MLKKLNEWHGKSEGVTEGFIYTIREDGYFVDDGGVDRKADNGVWSDVEWPVTKLNDAGEPTNVTIDDTLKERGKRYGTFKGHSELSQKLLTSILCHTTANDVKLSDVHREALQMICHKIARIANGDPNYDDSWRDIAGYAQLVVKHLNGEDV